MTDLNDENFRAAVSSLRENEAMWAYQLQMIVGHPVTLTLDFDSLDGKFERVMPFIHQGLTGVIEAFSVIMIDPVVRDNLFSRIRRVEIGDAGDGPDCKAMLTSGTLAVRVPLQPGDVRAPVHLVANTLRSLIGLAPLDGDRYEYAAKFIVELETLMRADGIWPGPKPPGTIEVRGAFGCENMTFESWLAWVLIPRVKDIVDTRGAFPDQSSVGAYAVRQFDGGNADDVVSALIAFDDIINGIPNPRD